MADERDRVGELFHGKYRILSQIGIGGFGTVYEARDERGAGNLVAIKVLRKHAARSPELMRRFKREARHLTRLHHPNIVDWKVFDEDEEATPYFVMELVQGEELHELLKRQGPLPWNRTAKLLLGVLDALHAAHEAGLLHLDLKPRNVFVVPDRRGDDDTVRVIDFGIAQYVGAEDDEVIDSRGADPVARLARDHRPETDSGASMVTLSLGGVTTMVTDAAGNQFERSIACTPNYVSPEQGAHVLGHDDIAPLDGRADLFSVGLMAYEMLTGKLPYDPVMMDRDILPQHVHRPPHMASEAGIKAPKAFLRFLDRMLAFDREKRWGSAAAAHRGLLEIVRPSIRRSMVRVVLPAVVLLLGFVGWGAWRAGGSGGVPLAQALFEGHDISASGLAMGPARSRVVLQLESTDLDAWAQAASAGKLSLVSLHTGAHLAGWRVGWEDGQGLVVEAGAQVAGLGSFEWSQSSIVGGPERLQPFALSWLGAGIWKLSVRIAGVEIVPGDGIPRLDPVGLPLDLLVSSPPTQEREADPFSQIESVEVSASEWHDPDVAPGEHSRYVVTDLVEKRQWSDSSAGRSYRLLMDDGLGLTDGDWSFQFVVTDRAGGSQALILNEPVRVDSQPLAVDQAALFSAGPDGGLQGLIEVLGVPVLTPRSLPLLQVDLSGSGVVQWELLDADGSVVRDGASEAAVRHVIPLETTWFGDRALDGRIKITARDGDDILRAHPETRGVATAELRFRFQPRPVTLIPQASDDATFRPLPPESAEGGRSTDRGTFSTTGGGLLRLEVPSLGAADRLPLDLVVLWRSAEDGTEVARQMDQTLRRRASSYVDVSVSPQSGQLSDGRYVWELEAFAVDPRSGLSSDEPEWLGRYDLLVDRRSPVIATGPLTGFGPVRRGDPPPPPVAIEVHDELGLASVEWFRVSDLPGEAATLLGGVAADDLGGTEATAAVPWQLATDAPDGTYGLLVIATDQAGNASERTATLAVSRVGPAVQLVQPLADTDGSPRPWSPSIKPGLWPFLAEVTSAHGFGAMSAVVRSLDGSRTLGLDLRPEPQVDRSRTLLRAEVAFDWRWSGAEVEVALTANDRHGTSRGETVFGPFQLSTIEAPRPEALAVDFGDHGVQSMRLVPGNATRAYVFGGRSDSRENVTFEDAGLPPFNAQLGSGAPRAWEIEYAAGEIPDFYLDEHEVTVAQFREFLDADRGWAEPLHWPGVGPPEASRRSGLVAHLATLDDDDPATGITWDEAAAYASWVGKRLPSLVEWEYAVRGLDYRPWSSSHVPPKLEPNVSSPANYQERLNRRLATGLLPPDLSGTGHTPVLFEEDVTPDTRIGGLCSAGAEWTNTPESLGSEGSALTMPRADLLAHKAVCLDPSLSPASPNSPSFWVVGRLSNLGQPTFDSVMPMPREAARSDIGFRCALAYVDFLRRLDSPAGPTLIEVRP